MTIDCQPGDEVFLASVYFDSRGATPYVVRACVLMPGEGIVRLPSGAARTLHIDETVHKNREEAHETISRKILNHAEALAAQASDVSSIATVIL